jgi:hypothetical protein
MRLLGICCASFSSGASHFPYRSPQAYDDIRIGLGELTFLQLSTTYAPPPVAGHSVGSVDQPITFDVPWLMYLAGILHPAQAQQAL